MVSPFPSKAQELTWLRTGLGLGIHVPGVSTLRGSCQQTELSHFLL